MGNTTSRPRRSTVSIVVSTVTVKDLKTGKTISIKINDPFVDTFDEFLNQVTKNLPDVEKEHIRLIYNKKDLAIDSATSVTVGKQLGLSRGSMKPSIEPIYLERVKDRSDPWVMHVKNLAGEEVADIRFDSPQEVSVMGLKYLIESQRTDMKTNKMHVSLANNQLLGNNEQLVQDIPDISNGSILFLALS